MGTIIAVKKGDEIAIGTDSLNVIDPHIRSDTSGGTGCLIEIGASVLGVASTPAYQLAFQAALKNVDQKKFPGLGSVEELYEFFLRMHEILRNHYGMYVTFQQGQEFEWSPMNGVLANQSGIYRIDSSRSIVECTKYAAIGSGKDLAIGAVAALYKSKKSAKQLVEAALAVTVDEELLHPDGLSVRTVRSPGLKVTAGRGKAKRKSSASKKKSLKPLKGGKE